MLRKTAFKLIFIGDSYSDTSVCPRRVKEERKVKDVVMKIPLDVVIEKNSLEEKTSLSTQVGEPGPKIWDSLPPTGGGTCSGPTPDMDSTITTETNQVIGLFTCLRGCRRDKADYRVNVRCGCGTKQVGSIHKSNKRPT